ncbi:MAG: hypothetical protein H6817_09005 [Phycisphaerales bacterium]|nr:hypothetical protein [Phycisphaerales bacterium]
MASGRLRRLVKLDILRQINPTYLIQLLSRFGDYFNKQGCALPTTPDDLEHEQLIPALASANKHAPPELFDALEMIDHLATPTGMDVLRPVITDAAFRAEMQGLFTPADIAVRAWLRDPSLLQRAYASQLSIRRRSHKFFIAEKDAVLSPDPLSDSTIVELETLLEKRFTPIGREGDVKVYVFGDSEAVRYVVQRGGIFVRKGAIRDHKPSNIGYQPLEFDVVAYDAVHRELAVKCQPIMEQTVLREVFATVLAGYPDAFSRAAMIDLQPLLHNGPETVWCRDVAGIRSIKLRGTATLLDRELNYIRKDNAADLYEVWKDRRNRPPTRGLVLESKLEFEFEDTSIPRAVELKRGAQITLTRDEDGDLVCEWVRRRGLFRAADEQPLQSRSFWEWMERPEEGLATTARWQARIGRPFESLNRFFPFASTTAAFVRLYGETADCDVRTDVDGALLAVNPVTLTSTEVDADQVALRRMCIDTLCRELASAMALSGETSAIKEISGAWWLGEYVPIQGTRFPVYLVAAADAESLIGICLAVGGHAQGPFILITPTRSYATPTIVNRLGSGGSGWLALSECAEFTQDGKFSLKASPRALLRSYLSINAPELFGAPEGPRFPTPPGSTWGDVRIRFRDGFTISVAVKDVSAMYTCEEVGMAKKRSKQPTVQWDLLEAFSKEHGTLNWDSKFATRYNQKRSERLAKQLISFFGINDDPFENIDGGWRTRFCIEPD